MKVLLFIPNLFHGGAQDVFIGLANYLVQKGHKVTLLTMRYTDPTDERLDSKVEIYSLMKSNMLVSIPYIRKFLIRGKFDVLLGTLDFACIALIISNLLTRRQTPVIVRLAIHITSNYKYVKSRNVVVAYKLIPFIYPKADGFISVSKDTASDLLTLAKIPREKIKVIYNPVPNNGLNAKMQEEVDDEWFQGNYRILISAGRLSIQKDYVTLIKAFAKLDPIKYSNVKLVILGEGDERQNLESLVEDMGISDKVRLLGFVPNPYKYFSRSEIFILSSIFEGLPNVLIQAMFCNLKLVSTDCPSGPREILDNGKFGELVEIGNIDDMSAAISRTLDKPEIEIPQVWLNQFQMDYCMEEYEKYLNKKVIRKQSCNHNEV